MEFGKACYSYTAVQNCMEKVKELPAVPEKKAQHQAVCYGDLVQAFDYCLNRTDCLLFDPDFSPWRDYADAVNRKQSKKELDRLYRACVRFLKNELNGILSLMEFGEVDSES